MAVSWTTVGNIREWVAKSWTDFLTLAVRARVGDRCFLTTAEGECYLTRKVVVTTDGNKTRWVPDDTARWGKNNLCTTDVFAGSVSDEGIWTITNVSYTLVDADLDRSYECLAIVFDCSAGNIAILPMAPDEYPHFLALRCVRRSSDGLGGVPSINVSGLGLGALGDPTGTTPSGAVGQFIGPVGAGAGGGGGGGSTGAYGPGNQGESFLSSTLTQTWGGEARITSAGGIAGDKDNPPIDGGVGDAGYAKTLQVGPWGVDLGDLVPIGVSGAYGGNGGEGEDTMPGAGREGGPGGGAIVFASVFSSLAKTLTLQSGGNVGVAGDDAGFESACGGGGGGGGGSGGCVLDCRITSVAVANLSIVTTGGTGGAGGALGDYPDDPAGNGGAGGTGATGVALQGAQ